MSNSHSKNIEGDTAMYSSIYTPEVLDRTARALFEQEREIDRLDGWFLIRETAERVLAERSDLPRSIRHALSIYEAIGELPLSISDNAVFAGTQRDAFAKSYALLNPNFKVSAFSGYCDPCAVFNDIEPDEQFSEMRIKQTRDATEKSDYVSALSAVYESIGQDTSEVVYFVEQVTGHLIPDFRAAVGQGIISLKNQIADKSKSDIDDSKREQYEAMSIMLDAVVLLAKRYEQLAREKSAAAVDDAQKERFAYLADTLCRVPSHGATNLYEAIQSFLLIWQSMCIEQAPNPFAFSVGNADRIFEAYRAADGTDRELAAGFFKHFLVFFNVADRSWAISQNVLVGGRDETGGDLTNETSYALFDAYAAMNLPQPILSVKLHKNTPDKFYREMGRFFFTPGLLTPSLFCDDALFRILDDRGCDSDDLPDYAIAGCQEPLIMGKDNGNTTNSWLNLAKILELALHDGVSAISGERLIDPIGTYPDTIEKLRNIRELFYSYCEVYLKRMQDAANSAVRALSLLPVPLLSCFMGGIETGVDVRDTGRQGTKYNGSGCLIHGLAVVADSFAAIDRLLEERPEDADLLLDALRNNFNDDSELREWLLSCDKFGNDIPGVDKEAVEIASRISDMVSSLKNDLGNPFRPDWSTPTTHLLYGYWVGATPDGRVARDMLGYGVDPLYGSAENGLGFRVLSALKLPYEKFTGGYASHLGLDPVYFSAHTNEEKGMEFKNKIISPLFFPDMKSVGPFYLYLNVTTPETLRKVLNNPKKYAPSGVYIMRIHGTFVNFLDLSPDVQQDIIKRLDPTSTKMA